MGSSSSRIGPYAPKISCRWSSLTFLVSFSTTIWAWLDILTVRVVIVRGTFELLGVGDPRVGLRVKLRSRYLRPTLPALLLLEMLRAGLLLLSLPPLTSFRLSPWCEGDRPEVLDRDLGRGEIVRRGCDLIREGVCDLANALLFWRDRVRPLSGVKEGILGEYD